MMSARVASTRFARAIYRVPLLRGAAILTAHLIPVPLANYLAFLLRFDGNIPGEFVARFLDLLPLLILLRGTAFVLARLHYGLWRYASIADLRSIVTAVSASSLAFYLIISPALGVPYPRSVIVIDALLLIVVLGGLRMTRRVIREVRAGRGLPVLVIGAGDAGEMIVRDMIFGDSTDYRPVGFLDDNPAKVGRRIHGVPVLATCDDVARVVEEMRPVEFLIAIPRADAAAVRAIVRKLEPHRLPIKTLPNLREVMNGRVHVEQIRNLAVEDLLARAPVGLDPSPLDALLARKRVLVTGAGGSIGSELCRQIASYAPASLTILDRYENSLHAVRLELTDRRLEFPVHAVLADISDPVSIASALAHHKPDIVFHAAAHKHVPLMEENPCEAIKNNVMGTRVLAQEAERAGVDRFILISTDKAVNPTSVMGASKRLAELLVQAQAAGSVTSFSVVRFGNVLGSNGSVVPRFLEQIRRGGPVTVTHPEMRRFFMLIPEAVQLVLHAAAQPGRGAIYVLEMGEQVRLVDLARDMIRLSGLSAEREIPIVFTGLRPGEKLFEELVGLDEQVTPADIDKLLRVTSRSKPDQRLWTAIRELEAKAINGDHEGVLAGLRTMLPEFRPSAARPSTEPPAHSMEEAAALETPPVDIIVGAERCARCSGTAYRSRARSLPERLRRYTSARRLYRCTCGWRGWLEPTHPPSGPMGAPTPPDLRSLDNELIGRRSEPFSPRDLETATKPDAAADAFK